MAIDGSPGDEDAGSAADAGACVNDAQCDDRIACTIDTCSAGVCVHEGCIDCCPEETQQCLVGQGCVELEPCEDNADCNDGVRCTLDRCADGFCEHRPMPELCEGGETCIAELGCIPEPPSSCDSDEDCTRGMDCLGEWSCQPEFGCQFVAPPECSDDDPCTIDTCDEAMGCVHTPRDRDGDGHGDASCGGDDCDDGDEGVSPSAVEVCDEDDEDCDGTVDEGCCRRGVACTTECGTTGTTSCVDGESCEPPEETCNEVDDDCDDEVDEGCCEEGGACVTECGSEGTRTCDPEGCAPPAEACDGADDDCDGEVDETFTCVPGSSESCTTTCGSTSLRTCSESCLWGACAPGAEVCNGEDDNCDGDADEGFACVAGETSECTTTCGSTGSRECLGDCSFDTCVPPVETCNGVDDNCNGARDESFACPRGEARDCALVDAEFASGTATCRDDCSGWRTGSCSRCGNGTLDGGEECDGDLLGGEDCTSVPGGFTVGTLRCGGDCTFDTSMCMADVFDPTGVWGLSPSPVYQCAPFLTIFLVDYDLGTMNVSDNGSTLTVSGGGLPCAMTGASARSSRMIDVQCTAPGGCDETYRIVGSFSDDDTFAGTFTATYVGSCSDCVNQSVTLTGSR